MSGTLNSPVLFWKKEIISCLCAFILAMVFLLSTFPTALCEEYFETNLSMYFADATMKEGKASKKADEFFSSIASIAMMDIQDPTFFTQLATAVDGGYKFRVFVIHEKGMPETDLAMLYCFKDSSWLLKDMTTVPGSVYVDVSWQVLQGLKLKMKKKELLKKTNLNVDASYECDPKLVWQIFMEFTLFIEERNKTLQQFMDNATDHIPALPEEIESWPLDIPISVQLPKELTILEAWFTAEPAGSASATFDEVAQSNRYKGTVDKNNLVSATIRVWEAGPHRIRLMITASVNGQKTSLTREIGIDTSAVRVAEEETCPLYADGHHWKYVWEKEHPHYGHIECACGAEQEDPVQTTKSMFNCCQCVGHDWKLAYCVLQVDGKGHAIGQCSRCKTTVDMTNKMPKYITDYLKLIEKTGAEGNTYFDEHRTGNTAYLSFTPPWVYIANQAINRYLNPLNTFRESFMNSLADPIVSAIELGSGEYKMKIDIHSQAQLYWIQLIQETISDEYMDVSYESEEKVTEVLDIGTDFVVTAYDEQTSWLESIEKGIFNQKVAELEDKLQSTRDALENVKSTSADPSDVVAAQEKADKALQELETLKKAGADKSLSAHTAGTIIKNALPYVMNAVSAVLEGKEAADQVKAMRSSYIQMLNDYARSRKILDDMRADAEARGNKQLVSAIDNISDVLDATYADNLGHYFDATTQLVDTIGNELDTEIEAGIKTTDGSFIKKSAQTAVMQILDLKVTGLTPLSIASTAAKILKCVTNYDEVFDTSMELAALSCIRSGNSASLIEYEEQVSPYTLALYAKVESEGYDKAADLVSTLKPGKDIDEIMMQILISAAYTGPDLSTMLIDAMNVDASEFGIGKDEKETVELMLRKEKNTYDEYIRKYMQDANI